jgi:galactose-1-phosphate uridylyltransferase
MPPTVQTEKFKQPFIAAFIRKFPMLPSDDGEYSTNIHSLNQVTGNVHIIILDENHTTTSPMILDRR